MQLDLPYELIGPDGTRLVTGNSMAAKADPDWIGPLNPDEGIVGLDSADVRESAVDIIGGDGGIHYDFFHGRRPLTISGEIWPEGREIEDINQWEQLLKRATNAMRDDAILRWTNDGFPRRRLLLRRQQPPRISGRRPKSFLLALVSADYRILADEEDSTAVLDLGDAATALNVGDETATPRFVINGPAGGIGNPIVLRNLTTGGAVLFIDTFTVGAGQQLVVTTDPPYPTVKLDGVDVYNQVDYLHTMQAGGWWGLTPDPAGNSVRVDGAGAGDAQVFWRSAWV